MPDSSWKVLERFCAASFSRWLSDGKNDKLLARQSMYGRMIERRWGDLAVHPDCPTDWRPQAEWFMRTFHVDAKRRQAFDLAGLLNDKPEFWLWFDKTRQEALERNAYELLVLRIPRRRGLWVAFQTARAWFTDTHGYGWPFPTLGVSRASDSIQIVSIWRLGDLLDWLDPISLDCPKYSSPH